MKDAITAIGRVRMNERRTKVKKENADDDAYDNRFFEQIPLQSFDGSPNETGAVIA